MQGFIRTWGQMANRFLVLWGKKIESGIAPPNSRDGAAIVSRKKTSKLYDESILSTGACQILANMPDRPHGFSPAGPKLDQMAEKNNKWNLTRSHIPF